MVWDEGLEHLLMPALVAYEHVRMCVDVDVCASCLCRHDAVKRQLCGAPAYAVNLVAERG